ncbi:MAG: GcrA family cell cycle regulator [Caulobacteraceae bacterium]
MLQKLWGQGYSASQIASQLQGVTRNAVIGKNPSPEQAEPGQGGPGAHRRPSHPVARRRPGPEFGRPGGATHGPRRSGRCVRIIG